MSENTDLSAEALLNMTTSIVVAHVSHNAVDVTDVPKLIREVYDTLGTVGQAPEKEEEKLVPAVPIKKSVTNDYIICLEDGKKLKMLKRHLKSAYDMTPQEYRERWNLPADYPMVAKSYAETRSQLAKKIGLGKRAAPKSAGRPRKRAAS